MLSGLDCSKRKTLAQMRGKTDFTFIALGSNKKDNIKIFSSV